MFTNCRSTDSTFDKFILPRLTLCESGEADLCPGNSSQSSVAQHRLLSYSTQGLVHAGRRRSPCTPPGTQAGGSFIPTRVSTMTSVVQRTQGRLDLNMSAPKKDMTFPLPLHWPEQATPSGLTPEG